MSYFQYESEFKALVDMLRVIVTGGTSDSVDTDSGTKPSIAKHLADNLRDYVRAANDRKGVANKAILDANLAFDDGALVEVTNDATDTNNGLYRKEGASGTGSWVKAATDKYTYLQSLFDGMNLHVLNELEKINIFQYDENTKLADDSGRPIAYSINDAMGYAVFLIDMIGRLEFGGARFDRVEGSDPFEILDEDGRKLLSIGTKGELVLGNTAIESTDSMFNFSITDALGAVVAAIGNRGQVRLGNIEIESKPDLAQWALAITDQAGAVVLGIDYQGRIKFTPVPDTVTSTDESEKAFDGEIIPADDMQFFSYGQSLSRGVTSTPVVSITQPYSNITFQGGVLSRDGSSFDLTAFKPLIEEDITGNGYEGETPTSGALNEISARMESNYSANGFRFIGSAPGRGGRPIDQLNKGTEYYQYLVEHIQKANDVCQLEGRTHNVQAVFWTQGEANYSNSSYLHMDVYERKLGELQNDIAMDAQAITGQKFSPLLICYQVAAHRRYSKDYPEIALAQLNASNNNTHIAVACPMYFAEYNTDNLHLTAEGSRWMGKYYGKVYHKLVNEKVDWKPLQPKVVTRQGKVIEVLFHLPEGGQLEFDTSWVAAAPNMGFDIYDKQRGTLQDIISTVEISGPERVRITLTTEPSETARLTYAHGRVGDPAEANRLTGPRGNLRDNAGDNDHYTDESTVERYMHNWCVIFDELLN